jgi:hypothetical protein
MGLALLHDLLLAREPTVTLRYVTLLRRREKNAEATQENICICEFKPRRKMKDERLKTRDERIETNNQRLETRD